MRATDKIYKIAKYICGDFEIEWGKECEFKEKKIKANSNKYLSNQIFLANLGEQDFGLISDCYGKMEGVDYMHARTHRQSVDLAMYRSGSPKWKAARKELRRISRKPKKKAYIGDHINFKRKYRMFQVDIMIFLGASQDEVREYHRHGTLKRMIKLARMRK